jgi:Outer membrane protein beta-barrel domain
MKKLSIFLILFVLTNALYSQDAGSTGGSNSSAPGVSGRLGFYGGVNFATIGGDQESYDETLTGFQLGLMYCIYSSGTIFSCWVEPGYNAIGSKYGDSYGGQTYEGSVNLGYIMVPVVARFQSEGGLFGDIGVQPQFLVSAKDKYDGGSDDFKDYVNSFDVGVPVGVGYEYKKKFGISARYYWGLSNIAKDSPDSKAYNRVFSLRLHYRL